MTDHTALFEYLLRLGDNTLVLGHLSLIHI